MFLLPLAHVISCVCELHNKEYDNVDDDDNDDGANMTHSRVN